MGTKRLARTIIEGGRTYYCVFERRHSHGRERATMREYEHRLRHDGAHWDDSAAPVRQKVHVSQHDKLGAPRRWLRAQRGRRWDDVYSEIRARFDTRTIPGHHIVFDHLIGEVDFGHENSLHWSRHGLYVDAEGRLRQRERRRFVPEWPDRAEARAELAAWLGERRVARRGRVWFWFDALPGPRRADAPPRYRQGAPLDRVETRRWELYSEPERRAVTLVFDATGRPTAATRHLR